MKNTSACKTSDIFFTGHDEQDVQAMLPIENGRGIKNYFAILPDALKSGCLGLDQA